MQLAVAQCRCRSRPWQPVDNRQIADDRAGTENGQNTLGAGGRGDADLEQAFVEPVEAVARIAGDEQNLVAA